jgi:PGF-CTERM protein
MRYALLPLLAAALVVVAGVGALALTPGALDAPDVRPDGDVSVRDVDVRPTAVTGDSATLAVRSYLTRYGGPVENVSVRLRATDLGTGFVEDTTRIDAGDLDTPGERVVNGTVTVPRQGGYRLEALVYQGGERVRTVGADVRGVGSLTPAYARTSLRFHRFDGSIPPIEFRVADAEGNRTALNVSTYLTNEGDEPAGDLRLVLTARQSDSNIVADTESVRVGGVEPGRTATPSARLTVPDDYNYYLDAVLWRDGVIVGTARSTANLAPTETIEENRTTRSVGIDVGDFTDDAGREPTPDRGGDATSSGPTPGFTAPVALAALAGGLLWRRFR